MAGQPFSNVSEGSKDQRFQLQRGLFKEIKHVTTGSPQPGHQKPRAEIEKAGGELLVYWAYFL